MHQPLPPAVHDLLCLWRRLRPERCVAAFDMDGTLIHGDAGDLVFQALLREHTLPLSWEDYQSMLVQEGPIAAYRQQAEALARVPAGTIARLSETLFAPDGPGACPPTPLRNLLQTLLKQGFECAVVSSSHQATVEAVLRNLFPREAHRITALGVRATSSGQVAEPAPIGPGKPLCLQNALPARRPLLTAGNSEGDMALLSAIPPWGLALWVDPDPAAFHRFRKRHPVPERMVHWPF